MKPPVHLLAKPVKKLSVEVKTLRWGEACWLRRCSESLEKWCSKHGLKLTVYGGDDSLPNPKFQVIQMLEEFLLGSSDQMMYVDADVWVAGTAPYPNFSKDRIHICRDGRTSKSERWRNWCCKHFGIKPPRNWLYRNAGVWVVDRSSAEKILRVAKKPFIASVMEQDQWNWWLWKAFKKENLKIADLPVQWNQWPDWNFWGYFLHLTGKDPKDKEGKMTKLIKMGVIPPKLSPVQRFESTGLERAIVYPWHSEKAVWEELKYSLRSVRKNLGEVPIFILGDRKPEWLVEKGVTFIECPSYEDALVRGVQLAEEICWMNDDIFLLKPMGWEELGVPLIRAESNLKEGKTWQVIGNQWRQGLGKVITTLAMGGFGTKVFSTHTPYVWNREKALKTLDTFGLWFKIPFETLYGNHHDLQGKPVYAFKADKPSGGKHFFNATDETLTPQCRKQLEEMFPEPAPWEKSGQIDCQF